MTFPNYLITQEDYGGWYPVGYMLPRPDEPVYAYDRLQRRYYLTYCKVDALGRRFWESVSPLRHTYFMDQYAITVWVPKDEFVANSTRYIQYLEDNCSGGK